MAVADGADEVRKLAEQMRQGADQVKIMVSAAPRPYDPLDPLQFSEAEIAAATDEATEFGAAAVLAHAYTLGPSPGGHGNGVRTIEHGNPDRCPVGQALGQRAGGSPTW